MKIMFCPHFNFNGFSEAAELLKKKCPCYASLKVHRNIKVKLCLTGMFGFFLQDVANVF